MLDGILIGLAVLCVVYFIIIVVYAGISTSFAFIWLFFAALLVFLVYGKWYYARNMERIPRWVPVSVVTTCIAGVAVLGILCVLVFLGAATPGKANLDYVIVLGARVKEHTVSNSLKKQSGQGHCLCGGKSVHHPGALWRQGTGGNRQRGPGHV